LTGSQNTYTQPQTTLKSSKLSKH